jgi:hypothetical protein
MNMATKLISLVALAATVVPCLLYFGGAIDLGAVKAIALVGTIVWFIVTPLWMGRELPIDSKEVEI